MGNPKRATRHVVLMCDCEGTEEQIRRIQDVIEDEGVKATWFFVGETVRAFPRLIREIASRHQAESHTLTHRNLRNMTREQQRAEIMAGKHTLEGVIGRGTRGFSAPMNAINRDTSRVLNEEGFYFDTSRLYFRHINMGKVHEIVPTWFREWMPLYEKLGLKPVTAYGLLTCLTRIFEPAVLPVHPHYSGKSDELAAAFRGFIVKAKARGHIFWDCDDLLRARGH